MDSELFSDIDPAALPAALALLSDIFGGGQKREGHFKQHDSTEAHPGAWQWEDSF